MSKYQINEANAKWRIVDGEAVIIHVGTSYYYSLNKTGTAVWELITDGEYSLPELVEAIADRFSADEQTIEKDLEPLIEHLLEEDLILSN